LVKQARPPQTSVLFNVKVQVYLSAQLTNLGDSDAHNTVVNVRARVGDSYVSINGQGTFTMHLGTVGARGTLQRDPSFEVGMSLAQGNRAKSEGIVFEIAVVSDEGTTTLPPLRCTTEGCAEL